MYIDVVPRALACPGLVGTQHDAIVDGRDAARPRPERPDILGEGGLAAVAMALGPQGPLGKHTGVSLDAIALGVVVVAPGIKEAVGKQYGAVLGAIGLDVVAIVFGHRGVYPNKRNAFPTRAASISLHCPLPPGARPQRRDINLHKAQTSSLYFRDTKRRICNLSETVHNCLRRSPSRALIMQP